ncbi:MAG: anti-sigma regulatory factor [Acidimicrobiales bacterium]|nr:anti-sigma regulatory factor [Acidimicrobiales bacterium]
MNTTSNPVDHETPFAHEAMLYASDREYVTHTAEFIEEGLDQGESVLVAVPRVKLRLLEPRFEGSAPGGLRFVAMEAMGRNPAWIIPAWSDFARPHAQAGRAARGIGEPVWSSRSAEQLVECGRHESLINLAFAEIAGFTLLCPYDVSSLDDDTLTEAHRNHPQVSRSGVTTASVTYRSRIPTWLDSPLSPVPGDAEVFVFDGASIRVVREAAGLLADSLGMSQDRIGDFQVAVAEAVSNSLRHGGGSGQAALWTEQGDLRCEVRDAGRIADPLAGRVKPAVDQIGGRGLWLMTQLCDLVQIRALPHGQVVRMHLSIQDDCARV